jgi:hypothetical protein
LNLQNCMKECRSLRKLQHGWKAEEFMHKAKLSKY